MSGDGGAMCICIARDREIERPAEATTTPDGTFRFIDFIPVKNLPERCHPFLFFPFPTQHLETLPTSFHRPIAH